MTMDQDRLRNAAAGARARIADKLGDIWWALLLRGLLAVALGIAALVWPKATVVVLLRLIGLYVLIDGFVGLLAAMRAKETGVQVVPGVISVAVGLILLIAPITSGRLLMIIVGLWALIQGGSLFWTAFRADKSDPDRGGALSVGAIIALIGLVLVVWPGTGAVTISWIIGIAALLVGGLLIYLARRIKRVATRIT